MIQTRFSFQPLHIPQLGCHGCSNNIQQHIKEIWYFEWQLGASRAIRNLSVSSFEPGSADTRAELPNLCFQLSCSAAGFAPAQPWKTPWRPTWDFRGTCRILLGKQWSQNKCQDLDKHAVQLTQVIASLHLWNHVYRKKPEHECQIQRQRCTDFINLKEHVSDCTNAMPIPAKMSKGFKRHVSEYFHMVVLDIKKSILWGRSRYVAKHFANRKHTRKCGSM